MEKQNILFLSDGYLVRTNVASIFYLKLMRSYGINNFCYYSVSMKTKGNLMEELQDIPRKQSSLRLWPNKRISKYLKKIPWIEELFFFLLIPSVSRKIRKFIKDNNVNLIIAVLRADVLAVVNKLNRYEKLPLLAYISDTVEAEFMDKKHIYEYKRKEYLKAISIADGIYVASEKMNNYIINSFNKKTSILRLGYESYIKYKRSINNKKIIIFFSGSVYASDELELFVNALTSFSEKYSNYDITLIIAGQYTIKSDHNGFTINHLGWMNERDLITIMQKSHIGYIPYKFDPKYSMQMKFAFPSKTGFYLSTGLPIFFHGPEYSSITKLFDKYPCGIHCSSLNKNEIVRQLEIILFDKLFYYACLENSVIAFNKEFSFDIMKNNFKILIDCAFNK